MAPGTHVAISRQHKNAVMIDVTSLVGAEEFVLAQNNRRPVGDPFGRQCFVEVIQSLIFMSDVFVSHPVLADPQEEDFGEKPLLLRALQSRGLVPALLVQRVHEGVETCGPIASGETARARRALEPGELICALHPGIFHKRLGRLFRSCSAACHSGSRAPTGPDRRTARGAKHPVRSKDTLNGPCPRNVLYVWIDICPARGGGDLLKYGRLVLSPRDEGLGAANM
jgi:hypothetical protein